MVPHEAGDGEAPAMVAPRLLPIVVVTGPPGVGKSTVANEMASRLPFAAHVKADVLHRMIRSGGVWPSAGSAAARSQHVLRSRNAFALADNFRDEGILPIVDDVLSLPEHAEMIRCRSDVVAFGLTAARDEILGRDAGRYKQTAALYENAEREIREALGELVQWIDASGKGASEVAAELIGVLDAAGVKE